MHIDTEPMPIASTAGSIGIRTTRATPPGGVSLKPFLRESADKKRGQPE